MRGFIVTLVSISLIALLVIYASVLHNHYLSLERVLTVPQPLTYAAYMVDDVSGDVHAIVGPEMVLMQRNNSYWVSISDTLPNSNFSSKLSAYESFLEGDIADETNSQIDANFSLLRPENLTVYINEDYVYTSRGDTAVFGRAGGTGTSSYDITVSTDGVRKNLSGIVFNSSGDLNISITYTDRNGSVTMSGAVFSNDPNKLVADYFGGKRLEVTIGQVLGQSGSLRVEETNVSTSFRFFTTLPPIEETKRMGYRYDATLDYIQGDVRLTRDLGK